MHNTSWEEGYDPHVAHNPISANPKPEQGRRGQTLPLRSLAPDFKEERHRLYTDLLERAIAHKDSYNVALTGAYGTGKSSILSELYRSKQPRKLMSPRTWRGTAALHKVQVLSLSTIAPDAQEGSAESRTNLIQKELVKQLLYRLSPSRVPQSRFHRPDMQRRWPARHLSAVLGVAVVGLAYFLGLVEEPVREQFPDPAQRGVVYAMAALALAVIARGVGYLLKGRPEVSASVTSGPATVTLANEPKTYFDEYLDELVYVFQASGCNLVLIEDIDRYEDILVFDTLRALNSLLNQSEQIGRRIVFVYAIRDSVFDSIGFKPRLGDGSVHEDGRASAHIDDADGDDESDQYDSAKMVVERASRTKFFDVIVPVVPFVSSHNARDLMSTAMEGYGSEVKPALIRLASRHVPDMRMIHNIRNEFEVYHDRLLVEEDLASTEGRRKIPGNNSTLVFALVLFKSTHLADFECIRHRDSSLDRLHAKWRELVRTELEADSATLARLRLSRNLEHTATQRAEHLGTLLEELRVRLETSIESTRSAVSATLLSPADAETRFEPGVWEQIATGAAQRIQLSNPQASTVTLSFSPSELSRLIGVKLNSSEWQRSNVDEVDAQIAEIEKRMIDLRASDWETLCRLPEYTLDTAGGARTFDEIVEKELHSDLAKALVRNGFITANFAQYVSTYYGTHMGPNAWDYTDRCIGPGTPDGDFPLSVEDVRQILIDQKAETDDAADIFTDVSIYNIDIVNYLLRHRPTALAKLAGRLTLWEAQESEFVDAYAARGADLAGLLVAMASTWAGAVHYASTAAPVDESSRLAIVDAVLHALPAHVYEPGDGDRSFMEAHYQDLRSISDPGSEERARVTLGVMKACGALVDSIGALKPDALEVVIDLGLYPVTESNLQMLSEGGSFEIDAIIERDQRIYYRVLNHLGDYIEALDASSVTVHSVEQAGVFTRIIEDALVDSPINLVGELVERASPACVVRSLSDISKPAWPYLARHNRTDPSVKNLLVYIEEFEAMDENFAALLQQRKTLTYTGESKSERLRAVTAVLAANDLIPDVETRVAIAASAGPGVLATSNIVPESGRLVGLLLGAGLLTDPVVFSSDLLVDWPSYEFALTQSKRAGDLAVKTMITVMFTDRVITSTQLTLTLRRQFFSGFISTLRQGRWPIGEVRAVSKAVAQQKWKLTNSEIELLREGGADPGDTIELISRSSISVDELRGHLRAMGGQYATIADFGTKRPTFPRDVAHRLVLAQLQGVTLSKFEAVHLKANGDRYRAWSLQRPR